MRVFVTGVGVVSPLGFGVDSFGDALQRGQSATRELTLFDSSKMERHLACEVPGFRARDHLTAAEARRMGRASAMAVAAARMAVAQSGIEDLLPGPRTAVILGTTMGEANLLGQLENTWLHQGGNAVSPADLPRYGTTLLPIHVARAFGARGMVKTLPAACAAGNYAIGYAADQLRAGRADRAICGATEVIEKLQYAGFARLGAIAPERCQPFDKNRRGLMVGEGAGMLILETEEALVRRGGTPLAEIGGYGLACDAHHITRPDPAGTGSRFAVEAALRSSGIAPADVDYINAHGTATAANDAVESRVINELFGKREDQPLVTSIKSMIGHCMGAASAIEAVSCILTLGNGRIPPTIHYETPDPECDVNLVTAPITQEVSVVLNNSLAFGGYDAVLCLAKPGVLPEMSSRRPRPSRRADRNSTSAGRVS